MLLYTYTIVKKSCCDRHTLGGPTVLNDLLYKTLQWVLLQVSPNKITFHSWNLLHVWNLNGLRPIDCHLQSVSYFCIQIRRERKELSIVSFQSCFNCNQVLQYFCWKPALIEFLSQNRGLLKLFQNFPNIKIVQHRSKGTLNGCCWKKVF